MTSKFTSLAQTTLETSRSINSPNYQTVTFSCVVGTLHLPIMLYKPALLHVFHLS